MRWRMGQDTQALVKHNRKLTLQLQAGLEDMGLSLATPADPDARGGSLMVVLPDHVVASDVVTQLAVLDIYMDNRSQTLRMSPGVLTTEAGIDRTLAALRAMLV